MKKLQDILGKQQLFFDGGTGTILQGMGLKPGELPETWNLKHPDRIVQLHYNYFSAGANIIKSDTFGAFITKFPLELERIIKAAIENANEAREKALKDHDNLYIAFDISSTGKLLKPMGDLDFEDCINLYKKTFRIALPFAKDGKIDCILIETMNDGYETKAAVLAAKEVMEELGLVDGDPAAPGTRGTIPILVTNVYDKECRTLSGSTPETMVAMLEGLGVDAIGVNCSLGPEDMIPAVERLCKAASVPVIVNPNAGLPKVVNGKTVFDVSATDFVKSMEKIASIPSKCAKILGGCCGTTPEYIIGVRDKVLGDREEGEVSPSAAMASPFPPTPSAGDTPATPPVDSLGCVSSNSQIVYFGGAYPTVLIGERINPTGKKKFKEALRNKDIPYIIHQGIEQEEAGAQVLDVNVGLPEIDEKEMMLTVMEELQSVTTLPLQIDTTNAQVMEAALRRYNGKPMINSVNGKQEIMNQVFPLVKKYGGLVVALTLDEDGIPETSARRIEIAKKIYAEAEKYGIAKKDIIIDPLAMAVSSDTKAGLATLETVRAVHEMGGLTSLGISNVSFGLPMREFVTASFFTMAMQNGLSAAIMNPLQQEMKKVWHTTTLLLGKDENCAKYIEWTAQVSVQPLTTVGTASATSTSSPTPTGSAGVLGGEPPRRGGSERPLAGCSKGETSPFPRTSNLSNAIIKGLKNDAATITRELLTNTDSLEIINEHLIPGLDYVGKRFEQKTMYLPQLLMAAEAAKSAFGEIRSFMEKSGKKGESKGKIIIATVKGDIHDIGKNIVKVLLENYDFEVIDLGKDVPPETVVKACKKDHVQLVGLSALMTTTVVSMEETIKQLRAECPWAKVCVGGAVMTQEYADQIGADFYGKDAMDTVRYAMEVFK